MVYYGCLQLCYGSAKATACFFLTLFPPGNILNFLNLLSATGWTTIFGMYKQLLFCCSYVYKLLKYYAKGNFLEPVI